MSTAPVVRGTGRRVRRPKDLEALQERLRDSPAFETFSEAFIFAACLGFARRKRIPFQKTAEAVPWEVFAGAGGEEIVNILAVVETNELEILADARLDERLKIFEEYLHGGLKIMEAELSSSPGTKIEDVVRDMVIAEKEQSAEAGRPNLDRIAEDIARQMSP